MLFGATWSLDSGEGIDDVCVFVTDQGEIAVYEGTDPSSATTFSLAGVYEVGAPLSKHAHFHAGGDVAIVTEDGIISLASAVQKDRAAISRDAITYPIEDAWREAVTLRTSAHRFNSTIWQSQQMLLVSVPNDIGGDFQAFVCNARTGRWCRYTNWDVQCSGVVDDYLYFGSAGGQIWQAESSGQDGEAPYTASWLPKFMPINGVSSLNMARVVYRGNLDLAPDLTGATDFNTSEPVSPTAPVDGVGDLWGTGLWGTMLWGISTEKTVYSEWQAVYGVGDEISIWCKATSARTGTPNIDLIGIEYLYEDAAPL